MTRNSMDHDTLRQLLGLPVTSLLVIVFFSIIIQTHQAEANPPEQQVAADPESRRQFPELPVLGYVTPWNSRGNQLVEEYRDKFDIVCPVWYTIHANEDHANVYEVRGGPPSEDDKAWYKRLQQPSASGSKALQITPRFILDNWNQDNYRNLVFNETKWHLLTDAIMDVVKSKSFDGVVFESGATHALAQPLTILSDSLHASGDDKVLVLVMPPIGSPKALRSETPDPRDEMIARSFASLYEIADYFSIMTYDMTGPAGRQSSHHFPEKTQVGSAQARGNLRVPGPNTSQDWVHENLLAFMDASDPEFSMLGFRAREGQFRFMPPRLESKFLMGLPLYGYTYPILFADERTGQIMRLKAPTRAQAAGDVVAILRGAGKTMTTLDIVELMDRFEPEVVKGDDGESFFDYELEDGYWRVYLPTVESMSAVLERTHAAAHDHLPSVGSTGIALWEVGQSSGEFLSSL